MNKENNADECSARKIQTYFNIVEEADFFRNLLSATPTYQLQYFSHIAYSSKKSYQGFFPYQNETGSRGWYDPLGYATLCLFLCRT